MRNIYNKGRFRFGEWGKHLRPFLKRKGNKRFRKDLEGFAEGEKYIRKKPACTVVLKITTICPYSGRKRSQVKKFSSLKHAENSLKRNAVLRYQIIQA